MKYIVMECHLSYAIVLSEDGQFLKVANRHYETGQTVTDIIEMQNPLTVHQKKKNQKWIYSIVAMAVCMMFVSISLFHLNRKTYATIYMTINPEIRIDVNRNDIVLNLYGENPDGKTLIKDYSFYKKKIDTVINELTDRAINMGYLHKGGQISLILDADSKKWIRTHSDILTNNLNEHLEKDLSITIDVTDKSSGNISITIPIENRSSNYSEKDYENKKTTDKVSTDNTEKKESKPKTDKKIISDYDLPQSDYSVDDNAIDNYSEDNDKSDYHDYYKEEDGEERADDNDEDDDNDEKNDNDD